MYYPLLFLLKLSLTWMFCLDVFCILTSSVSSPGRGCGSVVPPGEVWCPAVQMSAAVFSSSAAGYFAGTPRYRPPGH